MNELKKWNIRQEDQPLIEAAIQLGEYLKRINQISQEQKDIIQQVQDILKSIPHYIRGFKGCYQLEITNSTEPPESGKKVYWAVEIFDDVIEIFSDYETIPKLKDRYEDIKNELVFFLIAGKTNKNSTDIYEQWIKEISNPESFLTDGYHMEIETTLGNKIIRKKIENNYSSNLISTSPLS